MGQDTGGARDIRADQDILAAVRESILAEPEIILQDRALMQALVRAEGGTVQGRNVVDLRGRLVARLEARLDRLEDTHRTVIAAAYENLAGTNQVHRAVLAMIGAPDFGRFLTVLSDEVSDTLAIDVTRIGLVTDGAEPGQPLGPAGPLEELIIALPRGGADAHVTGNPALKARKVTLRSVEEADELLYGPDAPRVRSEAVMQLDLGPDLQPGLLAFGSEDPTRFQSTQGTDLLTFLAAAAEITVRRWLT